MPEVLAIENESFAVPFTEEDFCVQLAKRHCIGWVAEHDSRIVGYMVYELYKRRFDIINIAVDPRYRRNLVASRLMTKLMSKLSEYRRSTISMEVTDTNLVTQQFLRSLGFRAQANQDGKYVVNDCLHMAYVVPDTGVPPNYVSGAW